MLKPVDNNENMKIYNLNTSFDFGMHKGKTLKQVVRFSGNKTFDYPELKNKPRPKLIPRKPGEKPRLSTEEEIKFFNQGITLNISPNGVKYINWCIINRENFFISKETISKIKKIDSNFYLSEEALACLEEKEVWDYNPNNFEFNELPMEDDQYCGACMESPCRCSDPEKTSTTYRY